MRISAATAAVLVLLAGFARADLIEDGDCLEDVCLALRRTGEGVRFSARNRGAMPATLRLGFPVLENMHASEPLPLLVVVPPRSTRELLAIDADASAPAFSWQYEWSWRPGVLEARHDDSTRYWRPWAADQRFPVGQAVGGVFSHGGKGRYAYDFSMPEGTPIFAARGGVVVEVVEHYLHGGTSPALKPRANRVLVLHDDGTIARYLHLRPRGAIVEVGDRVAAGDPLGYSGDTGFSQRPHLHFEVFYVDRDLDWQSIDVRFDDGSSGGIAPVAGDVLLGSVASGVANAP